jgi:hypothetical protein
MVKVGQVARLETGSKRDSGLAPSPSPNPGTANALHRREAHHIN